MAKTNLFIRRNFFLYFYFMYLFWKLIYEIKLWKSDQKAKWIHLSQMLEKKLLIPTPNFWKMCTTCQFCELKNLPFVALLAYSDVSKKLSSIRFFNDQKRTSTSREN